MRVRVLNTAVQGFGVDQMLLKLEEVVPKYQPRVLLFLHTFPMTFGGPLET
jgi:hypothetical protein